MKKSILITGGAGFIGSHVVRLFVNKYPDYHIYNLDKLTYAGNLENLKDVEAKPNYTFIKADIQDGNAMLEIFGKHQFDSVIHLAIAWCSFVLGLASVLTGTICSIRVLVVLKFG